SPAFGAVAAHTIKQRLALYATPIWVHNTAAEAQRDEDTFVVGLAGRARFGESTYVVAEFSPRVTGSSNGDPEYGFGIEKRVGGHSFQLNFTNTFGPTFGHLRPGASLTRCTSASTWRGSSFSRPGISRQKEDTQMILARAVLVGLVALTAACG